MAQILSERGLTPYGLAKASGGRIGMSQAYRLAADEWDHLPRATLQALCDILGVQPGELFDYKAKRGKPGEAR